MEFVGIHWDVLMDLESVECFDGIRWNTLEFHGYSKSELWECGE